MTIAPNTAKRPGRMLAALIASDNPKGRMELTVRVTPNDPAKAALHRAFSIKKWVAKDDPAVARLFVALPDTADWGMGIKPVTPISVDLATGEVKTNTHDARVTPQLIYAAEQALHYARTGDVGHPKNGTVEVKESLRCGHCGIKLKDPVSIDRGIGPKCYGKATGSQAIKIGKPTIVDLASQIQLAGVA